MKRWLTPQRTFSQWNCIHCSLLTVYQVREQNKLNILLCNDNSKWTKWWKRSRSLQIDGYKVTDHLCNEWYNQWSKSLITQHTSSNLGNSIGGHRLSLGFDKDSMNNILCTQTVYRIITPTSTRNALLCWKTRRLSYTGGTRPCVSWNPLKINGMVMCSREYTIELLFIPRVFLQ